METGDAKIFQYFDTVITVEELVFLKTINTKLSLKFSHSKIFDIYN